MSYTKKQIGSCYRCPMALGKYTHSVRCKLERRRGEYDPEKHEGCIPVWCPLVQTVRPDCDDDCKECPEAGPRPVCLE